MIRHGGPRLKAGRKPLADSDECARDHQLRISFTQWELEVLRQLGVQWKVPTATAAYGLILDVINECGGAESVTNSGIKKLIVKASQVVLNGQKESKRTNGS